MRKRFFCYLCRRGKVVSWRVLITQEDLTVEQAAERLRDTVLDPLYAPLAAEWDMILVQRGDQRATLPHP